jgi:hypothetical protein
VDDRLTSTFYFLGFYFLGRHRRPGRMARAASSALARRVRLEESYGRTRKNTHARLPDLPLSNEEGDSISSPHEGAHDRARPRASVGATTWPARAPFFFAATRPSPQRSMCVYAERAQTVPLSWAAGDSARSHRSGRCDRAGQPAVSECSQAAAPTARASTPAVLRSARCA